MLAAGVLLVNGTDTQQSVPLRAPLASTIPAAMAGYSGRDLEIPMEEVRVAGVTDYLFRVYERPKAEVVAPITLYVGYYASQARGRTIHSPRNCLPGAGWEALAAQREVLSTPDGPRVVNRYLIQRGDERALVLYWYQGRGRTEANEYAVKWDLLRDAALRGRSEEALVRVLVPVTTSEEEAFRVAARVAQGTFPALEHALPT